MPPKQRLPGQGRAASRRKVRAAASTVDGSLANNLSRFSESVRQRTDLLHTDTLAAVTGTRASVRALNGRSSLLSDTISEAVAAFRQELVQLERLTKSAVLSKHIQSLMRVADVIRQLMSEVLSFNVTEHESIRDLTRTVLAASRHDLSQAAPASMNSIRFMMEPSYVRGEFGSQSVRTALRGQTTQPSTDQDSVADRVG